jgi:Cu/Ag efflux pump CusA
VTLQGAVPRREGWFVPAAALRANDRIVVSGAGTLLGLEHAASADGATNSDAFVHRPPICAILDRAGARAGPARAWRDADGGAAYDVFPEFVPPQASVQTEAPGYTPRQVEMLITRPLEAVINGANGVETVRSDRSRAVGHRRDLPRRRRSLSRAAAGVEALADAIPQLPAGSDTPRITPLTSSTMDLLKIGFTSDRLSPMALRDLVEWTVRPRLLAAPGWRARTCSAANSAGSRCAPIPRLLARGLTFADLAGAVDARSTSTAAALPTRPASAS